MKKVLKIIGIVVLVLLVILIATPFLFKGTIERQVKKAINKNIKATVEWNDLSLSFIRSFPDARLKLNDLSVINKEPFAGDTLLATKTLYLDMGIPQLFRGGDQPLSINQLGLNKAFVNIEINEKGEANYDITKETAEEKEGEEESGLSLDVKHYEINDSRINYLDDKSKMFLRVFDLNHEGTGDFSVETSTLKTKTNALVSFAMDSTEYLNKNKVQLDADIAMDLKNMRFSFEKNRLLLNQLPLEFDGYLQVNEDNQDLDMTFETPSSDFKNFLGVVPEKYAKGLDKVETKGHFSVKGKLSGTIDEEHIPKINIVMSGDDAYFKYPDLPKAVKNIGFDVVLKDETGLMKDLNLDVDRLTFQIDQDVFSAHGHFEDLAGNMKVDLATKGRLNLANLDKAYPLDLDMDLNGILNADMSTEFAMTDIDDKHYDRIKTRGSASVKTFRYSSEGIPHPIEISEADVQFDRENIRLERLDMKTGKTDAHLSGTLENLMGFLFKKQPIKGQFDLRANTFSVNDFTVKQSGDAKAEENEDEKEKQKGESSQEAIKIPSFLDVVLNVKADNVLYDNLTLTDVGGTLTIRNETATLKSITADIFGGNIGLNGSVATKGDTPKINMDLDLKHIDIIQSIEKLDLLKNFAPITRALSGKLSTKIDMSGDLTKNLIPIYTTLNGDGMATVLNAGVHKDKLPLVSELNDKLNFIDFDKLDHIKNLTTHFKIKNGGINFAPFDFKINRDISAKIEGRHTFDNKMDYEMTLDLPGKYLGKDIGGGLAKLTNTDLEDTEVSVPISFSGSVDQPKIKLDLKSATKELTDRIVKKQKEDLKEKGINKLKSLLGDDKSDEEKAEQEKDSAKTGKESTKEKAKEVLQGLFGKKKHKKDKN